MSESEKVGSEFANLPPRIHEEVRVLSQHWAQLAVMCGIREDDEKLFGFFLLMQGISDFYDDGRAESHRAGMDAGCAMMHRLTSDDWNKGAVAGAKLICGQFGIEVPQYIQELNAEVEYRDSQLRSETEAGKLLTEPVPSNSPIH